MGDLTFPTLGNKSYQASRYFLMIKYDPATNDLNSDVTMDAVAASVLLVRNPGFKGFDIWPSMVICRSARFSRSPNKLKIRTGQPISIGAKFTVETK